jgi:hypothetical protein
MALLCNPTHCKRGILCTSTPTPTRYTYLEQQQQRPVVEHEILRTQLDGHLWMGLIGFIVYRKRV